MFSEKQIEFFANANHRWNIKTGAVRSGKTYADYFTIPKRIRARKGKPGLSFIFGVSKGTIERNILEPLRIIWGDTLVGEIKQDNTCYLFGETVHCLGCEKVSQVSKIRGVSIKYAYGDEVAEWNEEVFNLIKSRLDKPYSCFDGALNPEGPNHWLKQFIDSDIDIYVQQYTIFDNPFLPQEFIDNLCKEYEGTVYYKRYILGQWALAEGVIYPMYADALYSENPCNPAEFERLCISLDYGTENAFAALMLGRYKGIHYAYKGYYYSGRTQGVTKTDTEYLQDLEKTFADEIDDYKRKKALHDKNPYVYDMPRKIEMIIDPSAASFIALMEKQSWCTVLKAKNDVKDGIRETAVAMKTGKVRIYKGIKEWQNEVKGYVWDKEAGEKGEEKPLKINDHYMDATRYYVYTKEIAKVRREYKSIFG